MHGQVGERCGFSWIPCGICLLLKTGRGVTLTGQRGRYLLLQAGVVRNRTGIALLLLLAAVVVSRLSTCAQGSSVLAPAAGFCWKSILLAGLALLLILEFLCCFANKGFSGSGCEQRVELGRRTSSLRGGRCSFPTRCFWGFVWVKQSSPDEWCRKDSK